MKALKIIGVVLVLLIGVIVIIGLVSSKTYEVTRSTTVNASPQTVFYIVSHFSKFPKWSPWQELDPNMKTEITGTDATVGAKYSWEGNDKAGAGSMTITKIENGDYLEQELHFLKPFESKATTYFKVDKADGGSTVVWGMKGEAGFMSRVFMVLMGGMDRAIGKDFEKGLAKLKTVCEVNEKAKVEEYVVNEVEWVGKECLAVRKTVGISEISSVYQENFPKLYEAIASAKATPGIPLGVYYMYDEKKQMTDMAAAVPYEGSVSSGEFTKLSLPAKKGYSIDYYGAYDKMKPAYDAMNSKLAQFGLINPTMVIEEYLTDPMKEADTSKWHTTIYFFTE